ncbi:hypothetical protein GBN33_10575 [Plesiomonas shigelloides]|uniref:hypothetical protein n=1 Tax=Plesiomonas shigelloides TaxID=703 RepID=UPI0012616A58|nr:hypothetical protein [Plesiomonas shigelloides]KAB7697965.1 hypothetical protein GBN33_10575 [Plesiomonas shigelloides]
MEWLSQLSASVWLSLGVTLIIALMKWLLSWFTSKQTISVKKTEILLGELSKENGEFTPYLIELAARSLYGVHIPYAHFVAILKNDNRFRLLKRYEYAKSYLELTNGKLRLKPKFSTTKKRWLEFTVVYGKWFFIYWLMMFLTWGFIVISLIAYNYNIWNVGFVTYNIVWFVLALFAAGCCFYIGLTVVAMKVKNVFVAKKFDELYQEGIVESVQRVKRFY